MDRTRDAVRMWWLGSGPRDARALEGVRGRIEAVFAVSTRVDPVAERPAAFDARRRQHSSTQILAWIESRLPADDSKVLALTDADLFIPILTFVFGEAQLGGRAAVVSSARLQDTAAAPPALLAARLAKEAAHELGHTFGLLHCDRASCVMSRSASLLDVDRKGPELCQDCRSRLADARRGEVPDDRP